MTTIEIVILGIISGVAANYIFASLNNTSRWFDRRIETVLIRKIELRYNTFMRIFIIRNGLILFVSDVEPPSKEKKDEIREMAKVGALSIPGIGAVTGYLFDKLWKSSISQRVESWRETVTKRLLLLEAELEDFSIDQIATDEKFVSTIMNASAIAVRNHQERKLNALRNIIVNQARKPNFSETKVALFLGYVDQLTPLHLELLLFLDHTSKYMESHGIPVVSQMSGKMSLLKKTFTPQGADEEKFYRHLVEELFDKGFLNTGQSGLGTMVTDAYVSWTSNLGKEFMEFISN